MYDFTDQSEYKQAVITGGEVFRIGIEKWEEKFKWIIIDGIRTRYLASNQGRIYTAITRELIIPKVAKRGYLQVSLRVVPSPQSKPKVLRVHRIIIGCFYEGEPPKTIETVNHLNGDKADNRIENLEYCSIAENNQHFARELKCEQSQSGEKIVAEMRAYRDKINNVFNKQQQSKPRGRRDISDKEYNDIKSLVEQFYPIKELCVRFNIKKSVVKQIISGDEARTPPDEVPENTIIQICEDLEEGKLTQTEIAIKYNVRRSVVVYLYRKEWLKFKHIWENYNFK